MYVDDMAMKILARLEAIERRLGMDPGPQAMSSVPRGDPRGDPQGDRDMGDRSGGPRRFQGGFAPQDCGPRDRSDQYGGDQYQYSGNVRDRDGGCRFNEKRVVDQIVELVTLRLEEVLRVLPQLIQVEPTSSRKEPPTRRDPPASPPPQ